MSDSIVVISISRSRVGWLLADLKTGWHKERASLLVAVPTEPQDVEAVTVRLESFCIGESFDGGCHIAFEGRGGGDIDDFAAVRAQEVGVGGGALLRPLLTSP